MSDLSSIVNVQINLSEPIVGRASFGHILILGEPPLDENADVEPVSVYASISEMEDDGWVTIGDDADPVGVAARVAFSQSPRPTRLYVAVRQSSEGWAVTLNRALMTEGWYVIVPAGIGEAQFDTLAQWTEAQNKLFVYTYTGNTDPVTAPYYRTAGYYGKVTSDQESSEVPAVNQYVGCAAAAKCLSFTPGSETWSFKSLSVVTPSKLTTTEIAGLEDTNVNYYETVAGSNMTRLGKVKAGEWIDVIRFRDWLQDDMQLRVANVLVQNPKIPYTNDGITLVQNAMIASLKAGQANGGIVPDEWDANGNLIAGFSTDVPDASEITAAQKRSRILSDCKFSANLAGAIHAVNIFGSLGYAG